MNSIIHGEAAEPMTAEKAAKLQMEYSQNGKTADTMQEEYEREQGDIINKANPPHSPADLDDDPVHPAHYMSYYKDGVDCLTAMKHAFGETAVSHFMICNAFKYIYRHASKGGFQDIDKAIEYLELYKKNGIIDLGV